MSLIISTGSNLGDRIKHLESAKAELSTYFALKEESRIYESPAVDYTAQPDFLNQVLSFEIPHIQKSEVIRTVLSIEKSLGRVRDIDKGPRTVDIDILFWNAEEYDSVDLIIPHPRLFQRSFIVLPLKELSYFEYLSTKFKFPEEFDNSAYPYNS